MKGDFDEDGFAIGTFRVMTYQYDSVTKELEGSKIETIVDGTGLPANCTLVEPPRWKPGYALVFDESAESWEYIVDYRGQVVYNIYNAQSETVDYLGEIKSNYTLKEPPGEDFEYIGSEWHVSTNTATDTTETDENKIKLRDLKYELKEVTDDMLMYNLLGDSEKAQESARKRLELTEQIEKLKEVIG